MLRVSTVRLTAAQVSETTLLEVEVEHILWFNHQESKSGCDIMAEIPVVVRDKGCSFVQWKVKVGDRVNATSVLAVYEKNGNKIFLKSPAVGTVSYRSGELEAGNLIPQNCVMAKLAPCDHPVVMKDMCADCGKDLRSKDGFPGDREVETQANTAMIHSLPELLITENDVDGVVFEFEEAKAQGAVDEERLLESRKLVLLVDLDQTLIHTTNEHVDSKLKDVEHFQMYGPHSVWYHTKLRPHAKEFLRNLVDLFELHICTFGVRLYAHTVAGMLDEAGDLFRHRILSRDECFDSTLKAANLKALFPCGDRLVCIIDDREDVWNFAKNVIHVKPYRFFKHTGDINAPPGFTKTDENTEHHFQFQHPRKEEDAESESPSGNNGDAQKDGDEKEKHDGSFPDVKDDEFVREEEEDRDDYLHYLEDILGRVHRAFYQCSDKMTDEVPDVKTIIPYVKQKVLSGLRIVFSGMIPTNQTTESSLVYRLALAYGARVQENIVSKDKSSTDFTTHLVAAKWGTSKVHQALKQEHVKIVNPDWFWCCVERWELAEESLFRLSPDTEVKRIPDGRNPKVPPTSLQESSDGGSGGVPWSEDPMLQMVSLSQDQVRRMTSEVDDALSDDEESSEDEGKEGDSDSEDSLTGQTPRGWKRKTDDLMTPEIKRVKDNEPESGSEKDGDDDDEGESLGSVDDEMAEALEREIG